MRIGDNDNERSFRAELRDWLASNVPADAPRYANPAELRAWSRALHKAGYAGLTWPAEHGGRGLSPAYQAIYAEESARAGAPDHVNVIGLNMVGPTIVRYGSAEQQARFLPGILSGETIFCQGFSEPDAGSDLAAVRTRAAATPEGYLVNGEKVWSSYAHLADYCLLLVRTDPGLDQAPGFDLPAAGHALAGRRGAPAARAVRRLGFQPGGAHRRAGRVGGGAGPGG